MNAQELEMLIASATRAYVFDKIYADHNNGKVFDTASWVSDVEKIVSDSLFSISPDKQDELSQLLKGLDNYAIDPREVTNQNNDQPQLVLK